MDKDFEIIRSEQFANKLLAAGKNDYKKVWIRDNVYVALAFVAAGHVSEAATIYNELFKIIEKYEYKLERKDYPTKDSELLHPRFSESGDEVAGHWANKQHDAVGVLLYGIGQLYAIDEQYIVSLAKRLSQKLINYLETCRYWEDKDNGIWEDDDLALHASSLAACIRGIEMVSDFCNYNKSYHELAKSNLAKLLPRESSLHIADMALLSLIWPYGYRLNELVAVVENNLLRDKGVIRYNGDTYEAGGQTEPQWVMGIPWLGIAHYELGNIQKAKDYLAMTEKLYTNQGLPEAYAANNIDCLHTPLAWSHAMSIVLRSKLANSSQGVKNTRAYGNSDYK